MKISVLANVKEVNTKTLVSGDKEVWLRLSAVGECVPEAAMLGLVPADKQVLVEYSDGKDE